MLLLFLSFFEIIINHRLLPLLLMPRDPRQCSLNLSRKWRFANHEETRYRSKIKSFSTFATSDHRIIQSRPFNLLSRDQVILSGIDHLARNLPHPNRYVLYMRSLKYTSLAPPPYSRLCYVYVCMFVCRMSFCLTPFIQSIDSFSLNDKYKCEYSNQDPSQSPTLIWRNSH
jgi:hypothetical protein